ncbi:MAG: hypothetical protein WAM70_21380, partial [Pyrinomonadaceae bacterium]
NVGVGTTAPTQSKVVTSVPNGGADFSSKSYGAIITGAGSNRLNSILAGYDSTTIHGVDISMVYEGGPYRMVFSVNDDGSGNPNQIMSLRGNGNVGIGTAAPGFPLEVSKSQAAPTYFQVTNSNTSAGNGAAMRMFTSGNNALTLSATGNAGAGGYAAITQEANLPLLFQTNLTERMRITGGGNVGIGTASPDTWAKLHVFNAAGAGIDVQSASAASWSRLRLVTATRTYGWFAGDSTQGDAPNKIGLYDYTAGAFRMMFDSSGNVGVGTSNPGFKFDVQNGQINASGGLCMAGDCKTAWSQVGGSSQWTGTSSIYYNGGNVGIGTTTPSDPLQIDGPGGWALKLRYPGNGLYLRMSANQVSAYNSSGVGSDLYLNVDGGKVGIGTSTPASNLQIGTQASVSSATPTTLSLGRSHSNAAGTNLKLKLYDDGVAANTYGLGVSSGSMDFGVHSTASYKWYAGGVNKMTLTNNGDLSVSGSIAAKYQDLAEWVPSAEQLSAGTVVVLDQTKSNQVVSSTTGYDTRVAGVISAQPGITLGEGGEGKVLVATTGRVRVKVDASRGAIQIGDLLVTSDVPGVAMKSEAVNLGGVQIHRPGTIIGKALEPLAKGSGEILVLLSLQ